MQFTYYYGYLFLYWWLWVLVNLLKMVKEMQNVTIKISGFNVDILISSYTEDELIWSVLDVDTDHLNLLDAILHSDRWIELVDGWIVEELDKISQEYETEQRLTALDDERMVR